MSEIKEMIEDLKKIFQNARDWRSIDGTDENEMSFVNNIERKVFDIILREKMNKQKMEPHGFIQWKGTDVCIDIHCTCGETSHFDGDFMYYIECPICGKVYEVNSHIELVHVSREFAEGETSEIKIGDKKND